MTNVQLLGYKCNMSVPTNGPKQRGSKPKTIPWISAFVPQISAFVPGNSAFVFGAIVFKKWNSPINTAAKPCHRLLKAFNHPTNSRWVQATIPHYKILWWDASWNSDTCGNSAANDAFPLSLIYSLASWRPKRPNKQTMPSILKIWKCSKNVFVSENVPKNVFVRTNTVFQTNTKIMHTYGCLGSILWLDPYHDWLILDEWVVVLFLFDALRYQDRCFQAMSLGARFMVPVLRSLKRLSKWSE